MFKKKQTETPYDKCVTVTETVFTERTPVGQLLVKYCLIELHTNPTDGLFVDVI